MSTFTTLRRLAASTAVALAFAPVAASAQTSPAKPQTACEAAQANTGSLVSNGNALNCYAGTFSQTLAKAAPDDEAPRTRAGGFMVDLEAALKAPADKPSLVVYPKTNSNNMLVVYAVVPPKGFETLPVGTCAQQFGKPLAAWNITSKGEVVPRPVVLNPEGSTRAACQATLTAMNNDLKAAMAAAVAGGTSPPAQPQK